MKRTHFSTVGQFIDSRLNGSRDSYASGAASQVSMETRKAKDPASRAA